jgi:hypothetical protein
MPKKILKESVLHEWVTELPFQMQALLLTAMRGPDNSTKHCPAKQIVRYLRGAVLKPAGIWEGFNDNDFMWGDYSLFKFSIDTFFHSPDEYPHHFLMHLIHASEVVGCYHPEAEKQTWWTVFYMMACNALHMNPESQHQLEQRLNDFGFGVHNKTTSNE